MGGMKTLTPAQLDAAEHFVELSARLLDRLRFAYFFRDGRRDAVLEALRAYHNPDGGFGNALEPDLRAPGSQPAAVRSALEMLDSLDAFDDPMAAGACDYLLTITTPDGGLPFMLPSGLKHPRGPWWETPADPPAAIPFTTPVVGLLHKHRVKHPWLDRATEYCWRQVATFDASGCNPTAWDLPKVGKGYEARALLAFLEHAPDRERADEAFTRLGRIVLQAGLVELDPSARGEVHTPLDYAPSPGHRARSLVSEDVIAAHLDALVDAQQPDGGWMFDWHAWNPATTLEWRGFLTVEKLRVLQAYGRMP